MANAVDGTTPPSQVRATTAATAGPVEATNLPESKGPADFPLT